MRVSLELHARRFFCVDLSCERRIFCERLPSVAARHARHTARLMRALELIGFAAGGEAGARLARALGVDVSPDTLLTRIRRTVPTATATPSVLGVDDFAFRRGRRYGTILVDLERRHVVDLLPDREAETLAAWLKAHPGVQIISRDRSRTYAIGSGEGAPAAVQVADRWHLLDSARTALEKVLVRQYRWLRRSGAAMVAPVSPNAAVNLDGCRARLLPHLAKRARSTGNMKQRTQPHHRVPLPPPRAAAWMLLATDHSPEPRRAAERLCRMLPDVAEARNAALHFTRIVRERRADELDGWLHSTERSTVSELRSLAWGLRKDYEEVAAALRLEWSNGQVEGQINRLKLLKRAMYGRAKLDLLKARVMQTA